MDVMFTDQPQCPVTSKFSLPNHHDQMLQTHIILSEWHFKKKKKIIPVFIYLESSGPPQGHTWPCHHLSSRGFKCQLQEVTMFKYGHSIPTVIYRHVGKELI